MCERGGRQRKIHSNQYTPMPLFHPLFTTLATSSTLSRRRVRVRVRVRVRMRVRMRVDTMATAVATRTLGRTMGLMLGHLFVVALATTYIVLLASHPPTFLFAILFALGVLCIAIAPLVHELPHLLALLAAVSVSTTSVLLLAALLIGMCMGARMRKGLLWTIPVLGNSVLLWHTQAREMVAEFITGSAVRMMIAYWAFAAVFMVTLGYFYIHLDAFDLSTTPRKAHVAVFGTALAGVLVVTTSLVPVWSLAVSATTMLLPQCVLCPLSAIVVHVLLLQPRHVRFAPEVKCEYDTPDARSIAAAQRPSHKQWCHEVPPDQYVRESSAATKEAMRELRVTMRQQRWQSWRRTLGVVVQMGVACLVIILLYIVAVRGASTLATVALHAEDQHGAGDPVPSGVVPGLTPSHQNEL